jgi:hypothetical protein
MHARCSDEKSHSIPSNTLSALDQELSAHDKERMLAFLRHYGDLSPDLVYEGSTRAGYKTLPGPAG